MSVHPSTYGHDPQRPQTTVGYQNYYIQPSKAGDPADVSAGMVVKQNVAPSGVEHDWAGDSFSNKIRLAFIRKVRRVSFPARLLFYRSY